MTNTDAAAAGEPRLKKPGFEEEALPWLEAVYRFSLRLTGGNDDAAQDLTQETFLRAYRHWETYTPGTSARSWLFTICRNAFLRGQEQRARRRESLESELDFKTEAFASALALDDIRAQDPERDFFDSFIDEEVMAAVSRLPEDFREAVVLSDLEGLSYNEIAEVMDIPIGTVKSRLYRGRRLLAKALHDYALEMGYIRGAKA
ncbi:MAG: sigma-70 family RNA polymerase sigma factor [Longimicrobiales bacterium]